MVGHASCVFSSGALLVGKITISLPKRESAITNVPVPVFHVQTILIDTRQEQRIVYNQE